MKKGVWSICILLVLGVLAPSALAEDMINIKAVREKPVNVFEYAEEGARFGFEAILKLLKRGRPVMLLQSEKKTKFGVETTLVENFILKKLELVHGTTIEPEAPFWGLEYPILPLQLGAYWFEDEWFAGFSIRLNLGGKVHSDV